MAALLVIVGAVSTPLVSLVRRWTPDSIRSRWVVLSVTAVLAILIAVATGQVPTPWAGDVSRVLVYFGVILSIGQAVYKIFADKLDALAAVHPVAVVPEVDMTVDPKRAEE